MITTLPSLIIVIASLIGALLTVYIRRKKQHPHEAMVCLLGSDCRQVINSQFSHFWGMPVELLGMTYYTLSFAVYGLFLAGVASESMATVALITATIAFLFSVYLTFIQAVTLKQWCTWCLVSALLSVVIFLTALAASRFSFLPYLPAARPYLLGVHLFGLALGLGAASLADFFFFRFLRDLRISHFEAEVLRHISEVIWFGLALLVLSGTGLLLADPVRLLASDKFLVKSIVVLIIIGNGAFLNLYIAPKLMHISFGDPHRHHRGELRVDRKIAFALGSVSFVSWYTAFVLGLLPRSPLPFWSLLGVYVVIVCCAVTGSQLVERRIARRGWVHPEGLPPNQ